MNSKLTTRYALATACLLGGTGLSHAFSLGPVSGATFIGRPLELSAPIEFDDVGQQAATGCVGAELLYGDRLIPAGKVRLQLAPAVARPDTRVRISSSELVDEPVVTLVLRAGCGAGQQLVRRYVLLPEAPASEPMLLAASTSLGLVVNPTRALGGEEPVRADRGNPRARIANEREAAPAIRARAPSRVEQAANDQPTRRTGRLQLALWEPGLEQLPQWLRASTALGSMPSTDESHRAAASALWRALNARPEDLLRTADRLRGLEGEASSLRSLAQRHRAEIASARESLEATKSQGLAMAALATLLALLAGGGGALFWHRARRTGPATAAADSWYGDLELKAEPEARPEPAARMRAPAASPQVVATPPMARPGPQVPPRKLPPLPMPPRELSELPLDVPIEFSLPELPAVQVLAGVEHSPTGLKVEALHGAQQQSEFFVSLGQFDEAVAVLSDYLRESSEKPVLAYLELFRIHHALGDRVRYEALESEFRQTFGLDFKSFSKFKDEQVELEGFPSVVNRIGLRWPSEQSQSVIEDFILRKPANERELLSLDAYRELVWLYELGQELVERTGRPAGLQLLGDSALPNNHFILPWAMGHEDGPPELSLDRLSAIDVASDLHGFAVDIDLGALTGDGAPVAPTAPETQPGDFDAFDSVMEGQTRKRSK